MARALAGLSLLALVGCAPGQTEPAPASAPAARARPDPDALVATMLRRLDAAAGCPQSRRVWCLAAGWERGTAAALPDEGVLVGVTIGLVQDRPDRELLESEVTLSALAVKAGAGLITDVPPQSPSEQRTIDEALVGVVKVLKGEAGHAALAPALARWLGTLPAGASHPLARVSAEWRMSGKADARIRRTPAGVWMAVEIPGDGPRGIFVSIYPDDWLKGGRR
jgi:hypothetical protein